MTLVGDAAHTMVPTGPRPVIRPSWTAGPRLALATTRPVERALERYEEQRRPNMSAVTMTNRKFGPAIVMELAEQRAPQGFDNIEEVISRRELEDISLAYKVEAGFDPAALNRQPP